MAIKFLCTCNETQPCSHYTKLVRSATIKEFVFKVKKIIKKEKSKWVTEDWSDNLECKLNELVKGTHTE